MIERRPCPREEVGPGSETAAAAFCCLGFVPRAFISLPEARRRVEENTQRIFSYKLHGNSEEDTHPLPPPLVIPYIIPPSRSPIVNASVVVLILFSLLLVFLEA